VVKMIKSDKAPGAVGPYSQAVTANGFAYLSGMLPLSVETGMMVGETATQQTEQIMQNISSLLKDLDLSLTDVVKVMIFLKSMEDFGSVNEVYGSHFGEHRPARSCVEVARLPKDALVEIEVIALLK
jgi:2-iminobutanoate/2-iminopropanoate deaminase